MASSNTAEITFTGNAADLLREYQKLQEQNRKLEQQLEKSSKAAKNAAREEQRRMRDAQQAIDKTRTAQERYVLEQKRLNDHLAKGRINQETYNRAMAQARNELRGIGGGFTSLQGQLASSAAGFVSIGAAALGALDKIRQLREGAEQTAASVDKAARRYAVQAGLAEQEAIEARDRILATAERNAVPADQAFAAATQLVSSGFNAPERTGTLDSFLKIIAAGNLQDGDPAELAKGMGQFLQAFGREKSSENLLDLGVRLRGLFQNTDVQIGDLPEFAKAAPVLQASGVSLEDSLSIFTALRQVRTAGETSTGVRNITQSLATASATNSKTEALGTLGLTPQDVDLVGETLPEALRKLKTAVGNLPEEQRQPTLTKLFDRENVASALVLLENLDSLGQFNRVQSDRSGFNSAVQIAQSGLFAAETRLDVRAKREELQDEQEATRRAIERRIEEAQDRRFILDNGEGGFVGDFIEKPVYAATAFFRDQLVNRLGIPRSYFLDETSSAEVQQVLETTGPAGAPPAAGDPETRQLLRQMVEATRESADASRETARAVQQQRQPGTLPVAIPTHSPSAPSQLDSLSRENRP